MESEQSTPSGGTGVHFKIATHDAKPVKPPQGDEDVDAEALLKGSWGRGSYKKRTYSELLQSSLPAGEHAQAAPMVPAKNGFVHAAILAYSLHHDLVIRPDDVWISILVQFNFYVNARSEELRTFFVVHEGGRKELELVYSGWRYSIDYSDFACRMAEEIDKNVVDPTLKDWILPDFSTTTNVDRTVASVVMMATMKSYFGYGARTSCGLPTVTLEGTKADWEDILTRIDKLPSFGVPTTASPNQLAQWADLLRPIITRFIRAFDGERDLEFWNQICHRGNVGSGTDIYSGWITAFCVWSEGGSWTPRSRDSSNVPSWRKRSSREEDLVLDGTTYPEVDVAKVPVGFAEVDVKVFDGGEVFECMMVAGHVGYEVVGKDKDGLKPLPAWFMFVKKKEEEEEEEAEGE